MGNISSGSMSNPRKDMMIVLLAMQFQAPMCLQIVKEAIDAKEPNRIFKGNSTLNLACLFSFKDKVQELLDLGATVTPTAMVDASIAACVNFKDEAQELLDLGSTLAPIAMVGGSIAACVNESQDSLDIMSLLIAKDKSAVNCPDGTRGPLHTVCEMSSSMTCEMNVIKVAKFLIKNGANPLLKNHTGDTARDFIEQNNGADPIKQMLIQAEKDWVIKQEELEKKKSEAKLSDIDTKDQAEKVEIKDNKKAPEPKKTEEQLKSDISDISDINGALFGLSITGGDKPNENIEPAGLSEQIANTPDN